MSAFSLPLWHNLEWHLSIFRFQNKTHEQDFLPRNRLDEASLLELFTWTEQEFLDNTEGSAIRRIGYDGWQRNIAVALGNAPKSDEIVDALCGKLNVASPMVREHVEWAIEQHI